ncbi:MAG: hypothetical protein JSV09_04180 [Thermoplasmata archaeon]|nr:MAG: hypothetical protein JSV09_04180 [Thermoplasmata archaeon]
MKLQYALKVALFISILLFSMPNLASEQASASSSDTINLKLQDTLPKADVSPQGVGLASINGTISCSINETDLVKVYLRAKSDIGSAYVDPSCFVFNGSKGTEQTYNFTMITRMPKCYKREETPNVTVTGYFIQEGFQYEIPSARQSIEIESFCKIKVITPLPKEIAPSEYVEFPLEITNIGNVEDSYRFEYLNGEELCDKQWVRDTVLDTDFQAGETKTVIIRAQGRQTQTIWRNEVTRFHLRITSTHSEETATLVRYDLEFYVREKGMYIPGFSPMFALLGIGLMSMILGKKGRKHGKDSVNKPGCPKYLQREGNG